MSRIIPSENHLKEVTESEKYFLSLCKKLPERYTIIHSLNFQVIYDRITLGESDFIIFHPEYGILFVEVKGYGVFYDKTNEHWMREFKGRKEFTNNPFEQSQKVMYSIVNYWKESESTKHLWKTSNPIYGFVVAFPFVENIQFNQTPIDGKYSVWVSKDLEDFEALVINTLGRWKGSRRYQSFNTNGINALVRTLLPEVDLRPQLSSLLKIEQDRINFISELQLSILKGILINKSIDVIGVAGSGKTLLAISCFFHHCDNDRNPLFLCYNRNLVNHLFEKYFNEESNNKGNIKSFHQFAWELVSSAGLKWPSYPDQHFWEEEVIDLIIEAIDLVDIKYGAVIIDEAQDFRPLWWYAIEHLREKINNHYLFISHDPIQQLYDINSMIPKCEAQFNLNHNFRNTKAITKFISNVVQKDILFLYNISDGTDPIIFIVKDERELVRGLNTLLKKLLFEKIKPEQITILSRYKMDNSSLCGISSIAGYPIKNIEEKGANISWKFSTIKGFKGIESQIVIVIDIDCNTSVEELYVAFSRGQNMLYIFKYN